METLFFEPALEHDKTHRLQRRLVLSGFCPFSGLPVTITNGTREIKIGFPRRALAPRSTWTPEPALAAHERRPTLRAPARPASPSPPKPPKRGRACCNPAVLTFCVAIASSLAGCAVEPSPLRSGPEILSIDAVALELEAMTGPILRPNEATFRSILAGAIDKDAYVCLPSPRVVFGGGVPEGERVIRGDMPHYGIYYGPMHYLVRRRGARFEVFVRYAVEPPPSGVPFELPDCALKPQLGAALTCSGTPYPLSGSTDACPASGEFKTTATRDVIRAYLRRLSTEAEVYYNRDAASFGLPVTYDFDLVTVEEARARGLRVDIEMPLLPTCGRTPYFSALRSGWSVPIVAHEIGHVMGLLDEYEALSGITPLYPKTPFRGAEISRMGFSMKEDTKVLPLHHYLILRRYFCTEPRSRDPYSHVP